MRGGAFLNGKEGRVGFRTNSTSRAFPSSSLRFLSPIRGTEAVVKTIERRNPNRNMILGRRSTISI